MERLLRLAVALASIGQLRQILRFGAIRRCRRRVPIVRGRDVESGVEVKQGLKDGDILVLTPPANLSDGLKVFVAH